MSVGVRPPDMERYILDHLDEALEKRWIKVYVQPVVRTISRQVCSMEALARWEDPVYGLLMPGEFIGVLEKHRRIHELDIYMLRSVCESYSRKNDRVFVPVSINLSRLDYELCDIFQETEAAVRAHKVPRSMLCIEITESVLSDNEALMRQYIERFRDAGYLVWMDDFGSGYSSLNVLKDFEFDELKIDMRFLSDFHPRSKKILASIVHMAKQIGIQTLAEGVETEEQFEFLRNIGCEKIQGFLFGRPMPYLQLMRHVAETGLEWETPKFRRYYDELGRLDVLSATPFETAAKAADPATGREMNSIPLAVIELCGDAAEVIFTNRAFEDTAPSLDWDLLWNQTATLDAIPLNRLSRRLAQLLDEARTEGYGKMLTVHNDEYYEMRARRLSRQGEKCALLLGVTNLSRIAALDNQKKLDDGLRSLYSVYEQVSLINLKNMSIIPLYRDSEADLKPPTGNMSARMEEYAATQIFPEDRARFLRFMNPATLDDRLAQAGGGSISIHLRTLTFHGAYAWKCYLLVYIREKVYYLLVRDAQGEVREFTSAYHALSPEGGNRVTPELLWANAVSHSSLKFFWKDTERRFLGASRSFLNHYGFASQDEVLGKTDEDMGWHIHPDLYRGEELKVLREGMLSHQVEGTCLVNGENQDIVASKMPLYSEEGDIVGLIGYFYQSDSRADEKKAQRTSRTDDLTGLLNSRGVYEDLYAYIDEYQLRGKDFARIEISIDDFADVNARFGYDFGDAVIRETGRALLRCCGSAATVSRVMGCYFTVLRQCDDPAELEALVKRIRRIPTQVRQVNGTPFSMYLSVGVALYSESESKEIQATQADLRRLTDDVENISQKQLTENTGRIFQMYDDLPMGYAVYKVLTGPDGTDAILLYANREYQRLVNKTPEQLIGRRVSAVFPMRTRTWLDLAAQAGLEGKTLTSRMYYSFLGMDMTVTAHQVIGPGFCAFTYQVAGEALQKS